jgi:SAM-dependent methyltransferase
LVLRTRKRRVSSPFVPEGRRTPQQDHRRSSGLHEALTTLRMAVRFPRDPFPFWMQTARGLVRHLEDRGVRLEGSTSLEAGTGAALIPVVLTQAGSKVTALDIRDNRVGEARGVPLVLGQGERLPIRDDAFDLVVSSNVLEHTKDAWGAIDELIRVCRPGGTVCLSWTNWLGPLGGHELSPFHYLGARTALGIYRATRGRDPRNMPGRSLFPLHVGEVLRGIQQRPVTVQDISPRYWPRLRFLVRVPGLREFVTWNCVILLQKQTLRPNAA